MSVFALPTSATAKVDNVEIRFAKMEFLKEIELRINELQTAKVEEEVIEELDWYEIEVSYYCSCYLCCGKEDGITASGEVATEGVTVALPPSIPLGVTIVIDGQAYVNQDRGGYIIELGYKKIRADIYLNSHEECYERGRYVTYGYIIW